MSKQETYTSEELIKILGKDGYYQGVIRGIVDFFKKLYFIIIITSFVIGIIIGAIYF